MDISKLNPTEAQEAVETLEGIEDLREAATSIGVTFSGNSGAATLKTKILEALTVAADQTDNTEETDFLGGDDEEPVEIAKPVTKEAELTIAELLEMDPNKVEDPILRRKVIRAKALRLRRVSVVNNDPSEADLTSALITVSNQYIGKVTKLVPFGEGSANGYHVPQVIYNQLKNQKFVLRTKKPGAGGIPKVSTSYINKYTVVDLPDLTEDELSNLANRQAATQSLS